MLLAAVLHRVPMPNIHREADVLGRVFTIIVLLIVLVLAIGVLIRAAQWAF